MTETYPWTPEYELDEATVHNAITEDLDLEIRDIAYLGEGWDFFNWLINDNWVFRFPKHHSDIDTLVHERRILRVLDVPIPHPVFTYWVGRPKSFHKPYAGYRYLSGTPLDHFDLNQIDLDKLGSTIGETLSTLHQQKITPPRVPQDPIALWKPELEELMNDSFDTLGREARGVIREAFESYQLRIRPGDQVTTHNDLSVGHILINQAFQVSAIIDWADSATANRYVDFSGLWAWGGDLVLSKIFDHYYVEPSKEDLAQIRIHGLCYALEMISCGIKIQEEWVHQTAESWVNRRVKDGELHNVYNPL